MRRPPASARFADESQTFAVFVGGSVSRLQFGRGSADRSASYKRHPLVCNATENRARSTSGEEWVLGPSGDKMPHGLSASPARPLAGVGGRGPCWIAQCQAGAGSDSLLGSVGEHLFEFPCGGRESPIAKLADASPFRWPSEDAPWLAVQEQPPSDAGLIMHVTAHGSRVTSVQKRMEPRRSLLGASVDPTEARNRPVGLDDLGPRRRRVRCRPSDGPRPPQRANGSAGKARSRISSRKSSRARSGPSAGS